MDAAAVPAALVAAAVILYAIYEYEVCVCAALGVWDDGAALAAVEERAWVGAVVVQNQSHTRHTR